MGHPRQSDISGPSQQPLKNGLGLVIGVMREDDAAQCVFLHDAMEQRQPNRAIAREAFLRIGQHRLDFIAARDRARQF